MCKMPIEERIERLRRGGFNPIHLWGNVYLVRYYSIGYSDFPFYNIKIFKE